MTDIKRMDLREFRDVGFLQEANRQFFHPLGLALEIVVHDDGHVTLGGVWDYRGDAEGMAFADADLATHEARAKADRVGCLFRSKVQARWAMFGNTTQPLSTPIGDEVAQ